MDLLLDKKRVLVTGASRGIGLACAKALALEGADLVITSRSAANLDDAVKQINARGKVYTFTADLSNAEEVEALADHVIDRWGYVDCLLLNTGGPPPGSVMGHSDKEWEDAFNSLLMSVVRLTRRFVPLMRDRKFGRILNIASTGVKQPIGGLVLSNSMRLAVTGYLKTLSSEVAGNNIMVNTVLPGATNTERLESLHRIMADKSGKSLEEVISDRMKTIPAGRFGDPENLAALATFLLSGRNGYITGQSIAVDGGMISFPL